MQQGIRCLLERRWVRQQQKQQRQRHTCLGFIYGSSSIEFEVQRGALRHDSGFRLMLQPSRTCKQPST
eukprot:scaffold11636_cov22-Tisochrysis_lutea.AAC.1